MSVETHFPVNFMTIGKKDDKGTAKGVYLRWFVKPYLGIVGISPLHPSGEHGEKALEYGFRLFYNVKSSQIPDLNPIPIDNILPQERPYFVIGHRERQGWKAFYYKDLKELEVTLSLLPYKTDVRYLRFNYRLHRRQRIRLRYKIHNISSKTETAHEIPLHYETLVDAIKRREYEDLTFAIHTKSLDECITEITFISNSTLLLGDFYYADPSKAPFYLWSPPGGKIEWKEIESNQYLMRELNHQLIQPGAPESLVTIMEEFYDKYYKITPNQIDDNDKINFAYPDLAQFQLEQPLFREYIAKEYDLFLEGKMEPDPGSKSEFHISPQDTAALISTDPAIAHLIGLFRVQESNSEEEDVIIYKIQGTWPDGKRFCIYSRYLSSLELGPPRISSIKAKQKDSERVLRDYLTFRVHHQINISDLYWEETQGGSTGGETWLRPVAHIILRSSLEKKYLDCLSPFFIPQVEKSQTHPNEIHYIDWYDTYPDTDINKVLDGDYEYHLACFDIFGQMSDFSKESTHIDQSKLEPGEIEKPEITLSKLPDPTTEGSLEQIEIPIEIIREGSTFRHRKYNSEYLTFDFSFFWPWACRYVWDRNRATGKTSLDYFRLLYLVDTPVYSIARFNILSNTASGIEVELEEVREYAGGQQAMNEDTFSILKKLGSVNEDGTLMATKTEAALKGGSLVFGQEFEIVNVAVSVPQASIKLLLLPPQQNIRKKIQEEGSYPDIQTRFSVQSGQLYWNVDAEYNGIRVGWENLSYVGEEIEPSTIVDYDGILISEENTPTTPVEIPQDLEPKTGLTSYVSPEEEGDYHFTIKLPKDDPISNFRRLQILAREPGGDFEPGEYDRDSLPPDYEIDIPESAKTLFSEDRIFSFYLVLIADDQNNMVYRGEPITFTSTVGGVYKEYLVYPDASHDKWRIIVPNIIEGKELPLNLFLEGRSFNDDNYLSSSLSIAVEAVVTEEDPEVKNSLQFIIATKKLGFVEYMPPPIIVMPEKLQPTFGIDAYPPDLYGNSLISVSRIYDGNELESQLPDDLDYLLYCLPADRLVPGGMPIEYAKDPDRDDAYRRNMIALKQAISSPTGEGLANIQVEQTFSQFAQKVEDKALPKDEFIDLPVVLPGESRTVFLYAIKAYDKKAKKESENFVSLSKPVYVEDPTKPSSPIIRYADIALNTDTLEITLKVERKLEATKGYGYATENNLIDFNLMGDNFPHFVKQYWLYLSNETDVVISPEDSNFTLINEMNRPIGSTDVGGLPAHLPDFDPRKFSIRLSPQVQPPGTLNIIESSEDSAQVEVFTELIFDETRLQSVSRSISDMPSKLYLCLRAENYLGQLSPLSFLPCTLR